MAVCSALHPLSNNCAPFVCCSQIFSSLNECSSHFFFSDRLHPKIESSLINSTKLPLTAAMAILCELEKQSPWSCLLHLQGNSHGNDSGVDVTVNSSPEVCKYTVYQQPGLQICLFPSTSYLPFSGHWGQPFTWTLHPFFINPTFLRIDTKVWVKDWLCKQLLAP